MAISSVTTSRSYLTQQLSRMNDVLNEKTSQLASGKAATTYGGVGNQRLLDLQLNQKISRIDAYQQTITSTNLQIETLNLTLERYEALRIEAKDVIDQNDFELQNDGQTSTQATAEILATEAISLLNTEVAGYYLYGGGDANAKPVAELDEILNGADGKDGLRTVMSEYSQANLGAAGTGRLDVSALTTTYDGGGAPLTSTFSVSEDGAHDFGFDISSVTSSLSNVTITGPSGTDPDSFDVELSGQPNLGESITVELALPPDGSETTTVTLTASVSGNEEGTFAIGADLEETTANLQAALTSALQDEASTTLQAASDMWAADQFFDTFGGQTPMRVDGPPYDTATGLVSGEATTLAWYTGENSATTNAREDKVAVVDDNLAVNYGARANEQGLTDVLKALATFVAADFSGGTQADESYYSELSSNLQSLLSPADADQSGVVDIATEIAVAYKTVEYTSDRHTQLKSSYQATIDEIEGVDSDQVAVEILQLQTNIEASYSATSILFNLTLADYL